MDDFVVKLSQSFQNIIPLLIIGNVDSQRIFLIVIPVILSTFIPLVITITKIYLSNKKNQTKKEFTLEIFNDEISFDSKVYFSNIEWYLLNQTNLKTVINHLTTW